MRGGIKPIKCRLSGPPDPTPLIEALDRALSQAVSERFPADEAPGIILTGGLEASLLAAMLRGQAEGPLHSFAAGLEGSTELAAARQAARELGFIHHERILSPEEITAAVSLVLPHLPLALNPRAGGQLGAEAPLLPGAGPELLSKAIAVYYAAELASQLVLTVVTADGAEDLALGQSRPGLPGLDGIAAVFGLEVRMPYRAPATVAQVDKLAPTPGAREPRVRWVLRKLAERYLSGALRRRAELFPAWGPRHGNPHQEKKRGAPAYRLPPGWSGSFDFSHTVPLPVPGHSRNMSPWT